jgi:hypothetical protein
MLLSTGGGQRLKTAYTRFPRLGLDPGAAPGPWSILYAWSILMGERWLVSICSYVNVVV